MFRIMLNKLLGIIENKRSITRTEKIILFKARIFKNISDERWIVLPCFHHNDFDEYAL